MKQIDYLKPSWKLKGEYLNIDKTIFFISSSYYNCFFYFQWILEGVSNGGQLTRGQRFVKAQWNVLKTVVFVSNYCMVIHPEFLYAYNILPSMHFK